MRNLDCFTFWPVTLWKNFVVCHEYYEYIQLRESIGLEASIKGVFYASQS